MRIAAGGRHFIRSHLSCFHELFIHSQGRKAIFLAECVGLVDDLLLHCGSALCFCCLRRRSDCRRHAGVGGIRVHLDTVLPVDVESHLPAGVPQLHIVGTIDIVCLHLHLLSIHIDGLPGGHRNDTRCRSAAAERRSQCHAGEQQSHILSSVVHKVSPLFNFGQ